MTKRDLTFKALRKATDKRRGDTYPKCKKWGYAEYCMATTGELGELCNFLKKVSRGSLSMKDAKEDIKKELADTMIYLDMLASELGVDLDEAVREKFNEVSKKHNVKVFL